MNGASNVLVLGVTGQVGKRVATNLQKRQSSFSVGSRRKANLRELADQFGSSRLIDLDDPRTFDEALKNVTGIFLITGYTVDMLVQSKSLIDAAKRSGVNHIVHLGAFTTDHDSYATVFAWHQMIEALPNTVLTLSVALLFYGAMAGSMPHATLSASSGAEGSGSHL